MLAKFKNSVGLRSIIVALRLFVVALACLGCYALESAHAQIAAEATKAADGAEVGAADAVAPRYGEPDTIRFRVGAEITASRGACRNLLAMVTLPLECPEQQVTIAEEDFSPEVSEVTFRDLP